MTDSPSSFGNPFDFVLDIVDPTPEKFRASFKALGGMEAVEDRDREFVENLLALCDVDSDLLARIMTMRTKLNNEIKLSQTEASELLEILKCRGFYQTGLNIDHYTFVSIDMEDAVVGRDLQMNYVTITRNNYQYGMTVRRSNMQNNMKVGGGNYQDDMEVGGSNYQEGMEVGGNNYQEGMKAKRNYQECMKIGGGNYQEGMEVEINDQDRMKIGESNFQEDMKVERKNSQKGMTASGMNIKKWNANHPITVLKVLNEEPKTEIEKLLSPGQEN